MDFLKRALNSWEHFGTAMMFSKAWEKYIVERYRFRGNLIRKVPCFSEQKQADLAFVPVKATRSIKICYLLHFFFPDKQGGTERFVLNLAKQQQTAGNEVCVITLGKRFSSQYSHQTGQILWEEFKVEGIPVIQMRYRHAPKGLYYDQIRPDDSEMFAFAEELIRLEQPDIVHFAYPQPFASFAAACEKNHIPYVVTLTDFNIFCHYATLVKKDGTFCDGSLAGEKCSSCKTYGVRDTKQRFNYAKAMLTQSRYITVPSKFVANVMKQEFPELDFHVVPHGIAPVFTSIRKRKTTSRFIYVGTLSPLKGIHVLLKAFQQVPGNLLLEIYGGGAEGYVNSLKVMAKKDPRISFRGEVPATQMSGIYQKSDCVIVPSVWFETYNFVLREALACGCIGIASRIGAMPEAVSEGRNGFLFEAGDVSSLVHALKCAVSFNWDDYVQTGSPSLETEAEVYQKIYHRAIYNTEKEDTMERR